MTQTTQQMNISSGPSAGMERRSSLRYPLRAEAVFAGTMSWGSTANVTGTHATWGAWAHTFLHRNARRTGRGWR